jgi:hypothetical protein
MAQNSIDIEVNLTGTQKVEKDLAKVEQAGEAVGETFNSMTQAVKATGGQFSEEIGAIGESASNLGSSFVSLGKSVGGSFTAMLGPLGAVVVGIIELTRANQEYEASVSGATIKAEAYKASVAEMTSLVEGLADAEVRLSFVQLKRLSQLALASQQPLEEAQLIRESNEELVKKIDVIDKYVRRMESLERVQARGNRLQKQDALALSTYLEKFPQFIQSEKSRTVLLARRNELQAELNLREEKALILQAEASDRRRELEQERQRLEKTSPKFQRELRAKEDEILKQSMLARREAQKDALDTQQMAAIFAAEKRIKDLQAIEDISEKLRAEAIEAERVKLNAQLLDLEKNHQKKIQLERRKAAQERRARLQREEAMRRQALMEAYQLRLLEIEQLKINGAKAEEILELRLDAELKLVEDSATKRQMVNLRYENERLRLQKEADAKAEAERQRLEDHRRNFLLESQAFDIEMMEDGQDKELNLLELKYQRQRDMKERSEEELTELSRRYNIERAAIVEKYENQAMKAVLDSFMVLGEQLRNQTGSLIFKQLTDESSEESRRQLEQTYREDVQRAKESAAEVEGSYKERVAAVDKANKEINDLTKTYQDERQKISEQEKSELPNAIGEVLLALGEQAAVESLMYAAKAVAAGFAGASSLAAGYGKASLIMAGAAVTAGAFGKGLTSSGGGGGGGGGAVSPLGTPQIAPEPEREQAESSQMVFNINFGGAVVYDTKQAAELALADRITSLQNINRRGAPRRRF